jgi:hypothetical protein
LSFEESKARDAIDAFCRTRNVAPAKVAVIGHLDVALTTAVLKGPDVRWRTVPFWSPDDDPGQSLFGYEFKAALTGVAQTLYERILQIETSKRRLQTTAWLDSNSVVSVSRWARFSRSMRDALDAGLGWVVPVHWRAAFGSDARGADRLGTAGRAARRHGTTSHRVAGRYRRLLPQRHRVR